MIVGRYLSLALVLGVSTALVGVVVSQPSNRTLIAGLLVTTVLRQRHPHPVSATSVERDLTGVSAAVVAVLDVILLVGVLASGADFASTVISLLLLVLGNACVVLMLWRARRSISRLWLEVTAG